MVSRPVSPAREDAGRGDLDFQSLISVPPEAQEFKARLALGEIEMGWSILDDLGVTIVAVFLKAVDQGVLT